MSRNNTGNPVGSDSFLDFQDNVKNLDDAVNSENPTFIDRLGSERMTWTGVIRSGTGDPSIAVEAAERAVNAANEIDQNAQQIAEAAAENAAADVANAIIGQADRAENAADRAEAAESGAYTSADVYASTTEGISSTSVGEQFQVVASNGYSTVRYRHDSGGVASEVGRFNILKELPCINSDVWNEYSSLDVGGLINKTAISWSANLKYEQRSSAFSDVQTTVISPISDSTVIAKRVPVASLNSFNKNAQLTARIFAVSPTQSSRIVVVCRDFAGTSIAQFTGTYEAASSLIDQSITFDMVDGVDIIEVRLQTQSLSSDQFLVAVGLSCGAIKPDMVSVNQPQAQTIKDSRIHDFENLAPDPMNYAAMLGVGEIDGYGIGTNAQIESFPDSPFGSKTAIRRNGNSDRMVKLSRVAAIAGDPITVSFGVVPPVSGTLTVMSWVRYGSGQISAVIQASHSVVENQYTQISASGVFPPQINESNAVLMIRLQSPIGTFVDGVPVVGWGIFKAPSAPELVDAGIDDEDIRASVFSLSARSIDLQNQINNISGGGSSLSRALREVNHIVTAGQSLSFGTSGDRIPNTTVILGELMPNTGIRGDLRPNVSMISTGITNLYTDENTEGGEYPSYGIAGQLQKMLNDYGYGWAGILSSVTGQGGAPISELDGRGVDGESPNPVFNRIVAQSQRYAGFAQEENKSFVTGDLVWIQGEADADDETPAEEYMDRLGWLLDDVRIGTGSPDLQIMMYQTSSHTRYNRDATIPLAQLEVANTNSGIRMACPTYVFPYVSDGIHMQSHSYRWMGCYIGKALFNLYKNGDWTPLRPISITVFGSFGIIDYHVPSPPLVIDTELVTNPGNYGYTASDSSGNLPISSVSLLGPDKVKIIFSRPAVGAVTVNYALGTIGANAGPTTGARGNIRDSDTTISYANNSSGQPYPLYNWCVISSITST